MKTSANGLAFIARWEGEVLHPYTDVAGVPTIGVGHAIKHGESFPMAITHDEAMALLSQDVSTAEAMVNAGVKVPISQNAFDACVSFTFNCGGGAFTMSSVRSAINASDMPRAAAAFLLWDKRRDPKLGGLVVDQGLLARRKAESALFLTPDNAGNS